MLIVVIAWFVSARHWFHGPVINIEVHIAHIPPDRNKAHYLSMLYTSTAHSKVLNNAAPAATPLASKKILMNTLLV